MLQPDQAAPEVLNIKSPARASWRRLGLKQLWLACKWGQLPRNQGGFSS
jgi:hypothetical protein